MARRRGGAAERFDSQQTEPAIGTQIPAPVDGWNARDPISQMGPLDAYQLDNWICRPGYVEIRKGYAPHVVEFPSPVESLLAYRAGDAERMFAAAGSAIYDATASGDLPAALLTGQANARWQSVNFANDAGVWLIAVNGEDTPIKFDGSAFSTTAITGTSGSITLDPTTLIDVMVHKRRLFFAEKDALRVWFLDADAIAGAAGLLDLGPVFKEGGRIIGMGVWSPGGPTQTAQAIAAFVTDQGEVAIYAGDDPADADNWAQLGVYSIGKPLGRRAVMQTASDLIIITYDGAVPLSVIQTAKREDQRNLAVTSRIQNAFALAANAYGENFGWEATLYPAGQLLLVNVPTSELSLSRQFVQSTQTGKWSQFIGLNASCWCYVNGQIFFGGRDGDGEEGVYRWDTGGSDNGTAIQCDLVTAFRPYGMPGRLKQFTLLRPIIRAAASLRPYVEVLVDYRVTQPTNIPDGGTVTGSGEWGTGLWGVAMWSSSQPLRLDWTSVTGIGHVGAARIRVVANPEGSVTNIAVWDESEWDESNWGDEVVYPVVRCQLIAFDLQFLPGAAF